jgi:hypothetical protein
MVPPFMPLSRRDRAPSLLASFLIASNENAVRNGALSHRVTFGPNVACTPPRSDSSLNGWAVLGLHQRGCSTANSAIQFAAINTAGPVTGSFELPEPLQQFVERYEGATEG